MKALVFSDLHIHNWSAFARLDEDGVNDRLQDTLLALTVICGEAASNPGKYDCVIFAGDLFEVTKLPAEVIALASRVIEDFGPLGIPVYAIEGNHDQASRAREIASVEGLRVPDNWFWIGGRVADCAGLKIVGRNYGAPPPQKSADVAVIHRGVNGAMISEYFAADFEDDLKLEDAGKYASKLVICGHYHKPQIFRRKSGPVVLVPGAPLQHTWGDLGQDRGYWEVEIGDMVSATFHEIEGLPKFVRISDPGDIDAQAEGNFVELELNPIPGKKELEKLRKKLQEISRGFSIKTKPPEIVRPPEDRIEVSETKDLEDIVTDYAEKFGGDAAVGIDLLRRARS